MIELLGDSLEFSFADVHPEARLSLSFQRTLRIPDDDKTYPLPPGLGRFPLRHVDDFAAKVPSPWRERGGVMLPMYQSEALWISFMGNHVDDRDTAYPFAVKIAAGKICAVTGDEWQDRIHRKPQDYVVIPEQPWLDGFCVEKGFIRQFVAMPLGQGFTAEEQLVDRELVGGIQVIAYPMKAEVFERRFPKVSHDFGPEVNYCCMSAAPSPKASAPDMGLAPGGRMRQEIYRDPFKLSDWDTKHASRCFIHIANSEMWRSITGSAPPTEPPSAEAYSRAGLPWFDCYSESPALEGSDRLKKLDSIAMTGKKKRKALTGNETVKPEKIVVVQAKKKSSNVVRDGVF